jgi:hypothetical protein
MFLLALLAATIWLCLSAAASPAAVLPNPLALAERAAGDYWGNVPCSGQIIVLWQQSTPPPAIPGTEVEAWVNFETPGGPQDYAEPNSTYTQCTVNISSQTWPSFDSTVETYPQFCQMIVHEFGHFEGYIDSDSYGPADIRYPIMSSENLPGVCRYDISAGTGLYPNGFPALPGLPKASSSGARGHCFEVRCEALKTPLRRKTRRSRL